MARLIAALIRHGDYRQLPGTPSAHQPFPLTSDGEAQARQAAVALRDIMDSNGWTLSSSVDSSQLLRAWQTAQIISNELIDCFAESPQLTGFDELAERGLGSANNLTMSQIEAVIREDPRFPELPSDWKSNSHFRLPLQGAESLMESGERVAAHLNQRMAALANISENHTLKLFIGHGAAFRHAAYRLGVLPFEQIAQLSMYHAQPVYLEFLSEDRWQHVGGNWKVRGKDNEYTD
jgi:broad specificity phosphatase PhoE